MDSIKNIFNRFKFIKKLKFYLTEEVEFKRWELVKYYTASVFMFLPCVVTFFHYFRLNSLFCFVSLTSLVFSIFIAFKINRWFSVPFVVISLFFACYHFGIGKAVGYQTLASMYETNISEFLGFLASPIAIPLILGGIAIAILFVFLVVSKQPLPKLKKGTSIRRKYLLGLIIVSIMLISLQGEGLLYEYPFKLFYDNYQYITEGQAGDNYRLTKYIYKPDKQFKKDNGEVFILIIGEAARRLSMSAYGYKEQTTPLLDKFQKEKPENIVIFKDAISASAYTRASVPSILSPLNTDKIENVLTKPSLSKIFRGAGCDTLYVTTRPKYVIENPVSIFQDDAENVYYLSKSGDKKFDSATLPIINKFIKSSNKKKLIILHLMGSHINYKDQYPPELKYFNSGNPWVDSYNDSLRYTDSVIQKVVDMLMDYQKPGIILYASDHGENLNDYGDGNVGHGTREFTLFELKIPFIMYFNDSFISKYKNKYQNIHALKEKRISHDNISHTFLGLSGIKDKDFYKSDEDLSSKKFMEKKRYITDENMNFYDFDQLKFPITK